MDNLEKTPITPDTGADTFTDAPDLQTRVEALEGLVVRALVLVLIISGTLCIYFWRLYRQTNAQFQAYKTYVAQYEKTESAATDDFLRKLVDFGQKHPDVLPIYAKYGMTGGATPPGGPPGAAPVAPKK
jgi:hypothetical protein